MTDKFDVPIIQNDIQVGFELDQRQKGLLWYSTYRVRFAANYLFENPQDKSGQLNLSFAFPAANGQYTALAQLVYLIGFSYAFFFEGFTGLERVMNFEPESQQTV